MISELELEWETVLRAEDEEQGIVLEVRQTDAGGFAWAAFDDEGYSLFLGAPHPDALSAQAAAVAWWKDQSKGAGGRA